MKAIYAGDRMAAVIIDDEKEIEALRSALHFTITSLPNDVDLSTMVALDYHLNAPAPEGGTA